ncbi:MAG: 30S ribosomal protein S17 [Candidatus Micrarchaeota archaeon]
MAENKGVSTMPTRGLTLQGVVVSDRSKRTVIVQRDMVTYVPKYKRYARKISKIAAHNPDEISAQVGDVVEIAECRKISKTKAWIVTEIVQKGEGHLMPGQVKAHDEAQRAHMRKHGGKAERKEYDKKSEKTDENKKQDRAKKEERIMEDEINEEK